MSAFWICTLCVLSLLSWYYFGYAEGHQAAMDKVRRRKR